MMRWLVLSSVAAVGAWQTVALAACPSGYDNEILCESFDTYCTNGGYPGSPDCAAGAVKDDSKLQAVWQRTSQDDGTGSACGTQFVVEDLTRYLGSAPFGGRQPCLWTDPIGQQSVSNWNEDPPTPGISFRIQSVFGPQYDSVSATDTAPLVLQFVLSGVDKAEWGIGGGLSRSTAYLELALGDDRVNTDYVLSPNCATYCNPAINQGPFPIMCAQGNPSGPLPLGCPDLGSAPVQAAMAIGTMPMVDPDPCHCGVQEHGPYSWHLAVFDGQKWFEVRHNTPRASGGTVVPDPVNPDAPMPPPADLNIPGRFTLLAGKPDGYGPTSQWVKLTIKAQTFDLEMTGRERSTNGYIYLVTSTMNDISRKYLGCFDQLRGGVRPGCALASSAGWTDNCEGGGRSCIVTQKLNANAVIFDDVVLHGGAGCTDVGACCNADNTCTEVPPEECSGLFQGSSTHCDELACCPVIYGDSSKDGSVDLVDFAALQRCIAQDVSAGELACECFDFNSDNAVSGADIEHFVSCANGPGVHGSSDPPCRGIGW